MRAGCIHHVSDPFAELLFEPEKVPGAAVGDVAASRDGVVPPAPDAVRLAVPKAHDVLAAGFEPSADTAFSILAYARDQLAPFQRIRRIEFMELLKTISGKIRRVELRAREVEVAAGIVVAIEWRDDELRGR